VAIETKHLDNVITIPIESLRPQGEDKGQVMLVQEQRIVLREVETGLNDGDRVEIKEGLREGDLIVKDGNLQLKANTKVKPLE
jgi:multidrug efflux pump subunit AcrA (membrane-fusion protein)